jgi:hypothetical protein
MINGLTPFCIKKKTTTYKRFLVLTLQGLKKKVMGFLYLNRI